MASVDYIALSFWSPLMFKSPPPLPPRASTRGFALSGTAARIHLARASFLRDFGGSKKAAEYVRGLALVVGDFGGYVALTLPLTNFSRAPRVFSRFLEHPSMYYIEILSV